ncbi:MAG: PAS domain-containing protein [Nitrospirae bacterium]|nr:PAS domain-containing protein [Nitrospirota bacterium]
MQWLQKNIRDVFDSITDAMMIIDREYNIVFANKLMLDFCNMQPGDIVGRKCHELSHGCSSPCPDHCISDIICPHAEIFRSGNALTVTHTHTMPDGSEKLFEITASPLMDEAGKVFRILEILRDITSRQQTEDFLQEIQDSMGEGLVVIDRNFRILRANKAYCEQAGRPYEEVVGRFCHEVSHGSSRPCRQCSEDCAAEHTFATGQPHSVTHTHYDKKDVPHYVELKTYPMTDSRGEVSSVIEIICDITEKKVLGDQLRHAQKMEALGTLTGGIAHDFNNILTVIMGYGHILQMKMKKDDPLRQSVDNIHSASEKAASLVQSLLAFGRKQTLLLKLHDINEIIRSEDKLLSKLVREDIEFSMDLTDKQAIILADSGQMIQLLMNLVANARDAMPDGGRITIHTDVVYLDEHFVKIHGYERSGKYVLLAVKDTGTGIDEMIIDKIFEPFFTTKELGKGTGLGLAMSYGIIKQHKGHINVASEPNKGTTFRVYLPLEETAAAKTENGTGGFSTVYGGSETILVAEDEEAVRNITTAFLDGVGYKIIAAVDGQDAVEKYGQHGQSIDLLIFDVTMPRKSGKAAYEEIRRMNPNIKAIFVSGYNALLSQKGGKTEEGLTFVPKPFSPTELLSVVRNELDS